MKKKRNKAFILVEDVVMNINFVIKKLIVIMSAKHFFNSVTVKKKSKEKYKMSLFFHKSKHYWEDRQKR